MSDLIEQVARKYGIVNSGKLVTGQLALAALRELSAKLDTRWEDWRKQLLDAWAKDHRATMTALLEGGPAAPPRKAEETTNG